MLDLKDKKLFRQQCYINGSWQDADSGESIEVTNPATGEKLGTVPNMGAEETRRAIEAAEKALSAWRKTTARDKSRVLRRWYELMMEHKEDLSILMTAEQGKPIRVSRGEIDYAADYIEWVAEEARRIYGDTIPADGVEQGKFKLILGGIHINQQVVNLIENLFRSGIFTVDFIDDHHNFEAGFQGLF